jgi:hypothetical protein
LANCIFFDDRPAHQQLEILAHQVNCAHYAVEDTKQENIPPPNDGILLLSEDGGHWQISDEVAKRIPRLASKMTTTGKDANLLSIPFSKQVGQCVCDAICGNEISFGTLSSQVLCPFYVVCN